MRTPAQYKFSGSRGFQGHNFAKHNIKYLYGLHIFNVIINNYNQNM